MKGVERVKTGGRVFMGSARANRRPGIRTSY
jgi:hypothetical protein